MIKLRLISLKPVALRTLFGVTAVVLTTTANAQNLVNDLNGTLTFWGTINVSGRVGQIAFAPGDDSHAYVASFGGGVTRYDYDPNSANFFSNPVAAVPSSITSSGGDGVDGSLGIAFHEDAVLGTVMYIAPAVGFGGSALREQDIVRVNDANGDGIFGNSNDLNQTIVRDISVSLLHQVNQMQVQDDTLFVSIGIRTQNGGQTAAQNIAIGGSGVNQSDPGETAYTGTVSFIEDLTLLSNDTTTTNISGFTISDLNGDSQVNDLDVRSDTQPFESTDASKLRVYATGFRNNFGLGIDDTGEMWVSYNQNENPNAEDELHRNVTFQSDHQFFKGNDMVGDWRVAGDEDPSLTQNSSQIALDAGYFDPANSVPVFSRVGFNVAAGGLDFFSSTVTDASLRGDVLLARNSGVGQDVLYVDRETGDSFVVLDGLNGTLDVTRDPFGNFLVGANGRVGLLEVVSGVLGDLDGDGFVTVADWNLLKPNFGLDTSSLTNEAARMAGDLDVSGLIDFDDTHIFAQIFDAENGAGSFASIGSPVPEPSTILALVAMCSVYWSHRFRKRALRVFRSRTSRY